MSMDIYAENILDHFRHPRNFRNPSEIGNLPRTDPEPGDGSGAWVDHEEWNHACGDSLHLWLKLDAGNIAHVGWTGTGCAISQASMSILSDELPGMSEGEALKLTKEDTYKLLGVTIGPRRFKCALMSLHTVKNALLKARGKPLQGWVETIGTKHE